MQLNAGRRGLVRLARGFAGDQAGGLTIFSLFIIIMMLMAGGLAVDFMRQETARVRLQSTLDRAILAAADMDQNLDPEAVVRDYFAKAGLKDYTLDVKVTDGLVARRVAATSHAKLDPYFLNMLGFSEIDAPAAGAAEESISDIEISLVLDISGSMGENQKIDRLQDAAKEFVDMIMAQTAPGRTTISIVPYATQVNAGERLLQHFNVTNEHDSSHCVDFTMADYDQAGLSPVTPLQRTGHFDPTTWEGERNAGFFVCRTDGGMGILPVSADIAALKAKIDSLEARGWTSIDVGVKWGAALLSPEARPAIEAMRVDGDVGPAASGRPLDAGDTLKVVVVMTDGINTTQWYLDDRYKNGPSKVWRDPATGALSIEEAETGNRDGDGASNEPFFIPETGRFEAQPVGGADAVNLSYPELWASTSVRYNALQMARISGDWSDFQRWTEGLGVGNPGVYSWVANADKDARLDRICTAVKNSGIRIYSIGFEVTDASALVMQSCATTPSHFFRVEGVEISEAFRAIANDIGKLRLTQ